MSFFFGPFVGPAITPPMLPAKMSKFAFGDSKNTPGRKEGCAPRTNTPLLKGTKYEHCRCRECQRFPV